MRCRFFHWTKHRFNGWIARSLVANLIYLAYVQAIMQNACLQQLRRYGTACEEVSMRARNRRNGLGQGLKIVLCEPATDAGQGGLHQFRHRGVPGAFDPYRSCNYAWDLNVLPFIRSGLQGWRWG